MTDNQLKFLAAVLLFSAWAGAIAAKHTWPDIDVTSFELAITTALASIGVTHIRK